MSVFLLILVGQAYSPILLFSGESGFLYAKLPVQELNSVTECKNYPIQHYETERI